MLDRTQYREGAVWNSGAPAEELAPETTQVVDKMTAQRSIAWNGLRRQKKAGLLSSSLTITFISVRFRPPTGTQGEPETHGVADVSVGWENAASKARTANFRRDRARLSYRSSAFNSFAMPAIKRVSRSSGVSTRTSDG